MPFVQGEEFVDCASIKPEQEHPGADLMQQLEIVHHRS